MFTPDVIEKILYDTDFKLVKIKKKMIRIEADLFDCSCVEIDLKRNEVSFFHLFKTNYSTHEFKVFKQLAHIVEKLEELKDYENKSSI